MNFNLCAFLLVVILIDQVFGSSNIQFIEQDRCANISRIDQKHITREDLVHLLLICSTHYDPKIPPAYYQRTVTSTNVTIQFRILSIYSVDHNAMDFSVDMILRQRWEDPRLRYNHPDIDNLELDNKMMEYVWVPDTYFSNEKEADFHHVTVPNKLLFIYRNGTIAYSIRIYVKLSCYMNLLKYPLDTQICGIRIESYGYSTDILNLRWDKERPVIIPTYIGLPQFYLCYEQLRHAECHTDYFKEETFACLETQLYLKRNNGYYIIQVFVPSILVVALSWVSFWIDIEAVPARISLGLMTVLTMTTQISGMHATLPRVSYIKAIDVWLATCVTFVFGSLLEFAYINVQSRRMRNCPESPTSLSNKAVSPIVIYRERARKVDKFARVAFPIAFILFNISFWIFFTYVPEF